MSAAFAAANTPRAVRAQVNVTPLVDVLLVLLVIFMLSVPAATQRLPLSNAPCVTDCNRRPDPVRVSIKTTGEIYWNGVAVTRAALAVNFAALVGEAPAPGVELHPQRGVHYDRVTDVPAAAHDAGVQQIGIASISD